MNYISENSFLNTQHNLIKNIDGDQNDYYVCKMV